MSTATKSKRGRKSGKQKAKILSKTLRQAYDDMTPDLRQKVEAILKRVSELDQADIQKRYDIGADLNTVITDKTGVYGVDPKIAMQAVLRLSRDSVGAMMRVAETVPPEEFDKLVALENPVSAERLCWNHIVFLAKVPDSEKRFAFAEKAITLGWTTKDLGKAIIKACGGPKSQGGRKPKRHAHLDATLAEIQARLQTLINSAEEVWLAPQGVNDQYETMAKIPGWKASAELVSQIDDTRTRIDQASVLLATMHASLGSLHARAKASRDGPKLKIA